MAPQVTVKTDLDGVRAVICSGEFDMDTIGQLRETCAEADPAGLLVVDVTQVSFADSTFVNLLVHLRNTRPLALQGPLPHQLHRVMELTSALALFEIH
ncbi:MULTISPECIES: STAS domain-containing protein [unclassified Streptomyces]|uniref:STAS domain-containing protein n=1 Tax=unclassified Streptomyces TaxID=2593676 RepID=UPI003802278D